MLDYIPQIESISYKGHTVSILRLDLLHPAISGNKWFKLKYNLLEAKQHQKDTIITFGGAFSNHIAATAFACREAGLKSIGIIRGEASALHNDTLSLAQKNGMELHFISREEYRQKNNPDFLKKWQLNFPSAYIVPEGGDNAPGQKGCEEILGTATENFTRICCAYGTGTTAKGLAASLTENQTLLAVNVLKYEAMDESANTTILNNYHFGGYAKHTQELLDFKNHFEKTYSIELDYVYTAKLFFAVFDKIQRNEFKNTDKLLVIHSGGLQGNKGYEIRYNLNPNRQVKDAQG